MVLGWKLSCSKPLDSAGYLGNWVMLAWVGEEAVDWHSPCRATTCRVSCVVIDLESR